MNKQKHNDLECNIGNIGNYICVDCAYTFENEDGLSAHLHHKQCEPKSKSLSKSNAIRKFPCQNFAIDNKHFKMLEDSDSDDDSSDEYTCEESDSSFEYDDEEITPDTHVWKEELPETSSPSPDRFPFIELKHTGTVPSEGTPLDYFNLFFTDELIQRIVDKTNCHLSQKLNIAFDKTDPNEIRVFLALTMLQGIVMKPCNFLYWSKKSLLDTPFFRQCMTLRRFSLLKSYLHFSNDQPCDTDTQPKLNKTLYVFDYLRNKFSSLYTLPRDVTVDGSLMLWKERLGWDQFLSSKKSPSEIKLYMLCDSNSGYVWDTIIFTGKGTFANGAYRDLPVSSRIVMSLMNPLLGKGYCLTTDKWYTSPQLADLLIEHQIDIYGSVKPTRKGIPSQLKNKNLKQKGEFIAFRRGKVVLVKYKNKKDVMLLSTVHSSEIVHPRSNILLNFHMPQIVKDYNAIMGEVDRPDQLLSSNALMRKCGKNFYREIFFHLVELVTWNSFIIYKNNGHDKKPLDFRMELIDLLVATYRTPNFKLKGRPSKCATPLRLSGRHFPSYIPSTAKSIRPSRKCAVCSKKKDNKGKKVRRESRYQCSQCEVGLCVVPCFGEYHTKPDLTN